MRGTVEQLAAFNEIARALTSTLETREVLRLIGEKVSALLGAQRWSLLLEGEGGMLEFEIVVGPGSEKLKTTAVLPGEGIAGTVFSTGVPRLVADVTRDPDFAQRFDEVSQAVTRSVVAVPVAVRGKTLGVLELVNGAGAPDFTSEDLSLCVGIAEFAAIALDNARNFQRVQELTLIDAHTGLYNTRHLHSMLENEVTRSRRFGRPISLMFLDLDRFKQVNDTHGHLAGSGLLRQVGELLNRTTRGVDTAFRFGGDEFAVVLLETDLNGAKIAAERVLTALHSARFEVGGGQTVPITASIGFASFPDHALTAVSLLEAADRAMYVAKHQGRDRVASA